MTEQTFNTLQEWFQYVLENEDGVQEHVCSEEEAALARLHGEHEVVEYDGYEITFSLYNGLIYITEFEEIPQKT